MHHRKPRTGSTSRTAIGLGIAATTTAVMAAATAPTQAAAGSRLSRDVAIAVDGAHSHADRTHVRQFDESFTVHEYGPSIAVTANNRATAVASGCSLDRPCRSVALSYQIVTTAGRGARLINATNLSRSVNEHCPACETFSAAYQFVVATPRRFTLSRDARDELAGINREVDALKTSGWPISRIGREADELARRVKSVLDHEAARAPRATGSDPLADFAPTVTMHRYVR
ncbi:hypothetical protein [Streptomyces anandii]|uniref:hypothetical protein n=1 Tax=Streptomyces anandii TaxID=285454 RepID=UPI00167ADDD1|nr:hypothetical protein [Streptomyces anandii]GGX97977.1 hypothetical protein GCM10010510_49360 [Streptomyces anandii JCM 4720]